MISNKFWVDRCQNAEGIYVGDVILCEITQTTAGPWKAWRVDLDDYNYFNLYNEEIVEAIMKANGNTPIVKVIEIRPNPCGADIAVCFDCLDDDGSQIRTIADYNKKVNRFVMRRKSRHAEIERGTRLNVEFYNTGVDCCLYDPTANSIIVGEISYRTAGRNDVNNVYLRELSDLFDDNPLGIATARVVEVVDADHYIISLDELDDTCERTIQTEKHTTNESEKVADVTNDQVVVSMPLSQLAMISNDPVISELAAFAEDHKKDHLSQVIEHVTANTDHYKIWVSMAITHIGCNTHCGQYQSYESAVNGILNNYYKFIQDRGDENFTLLAQAVLDSAHL